MSRDTEKLTREILEILYSQRSTSLWESGEVSKETLYNALDSNQKQIDKIVSNLNARNLIIVNTSIWSDDWISAEITSQGIDYFESLEDKDELNIEQICYELLEILYAQFERNQDTLFGSDIVSIDKIYDVLNYRERYIDRALKNLDARGLIELSTSGWSDNITGAEISQKGIDAYEDGSLTATKKDSKSSSQTIHIHGDVHGPVSQTSGGDTYNITNIYEGINVVRAFLESNEEIDEEVKEEAFEHLEILEEEAESDEPDKDNITRSWEWLKRNTPRFVESILTKVIAGLLLRAI